MSATTTALPPTAMPLVDVFRDVPDLDAEYVLNVLQSRPDMHDRALAIAASAIAGHVRAAERQRIITTAPAKARPLDASPHMKRMADRVNAYDYVLPHAPIKLGDATAEDIERAAEFHRVRAESETVKAAMFDRIRAAMGRKKGPVRAVLDEQRLAEAMSHE